MSTTEPTTKLQRRQRKNEERAERYRRGRAAETEIARRLARALDRLNVSRGDNVAQVFHAVHFIQYGYAGDSRDRPPESPDITFDQRTAQDLVSTLSFLLHNASNAKLTVGESDALPDE